MKEKSSAEMPEMLKDKGKVELGLKYIRAREEIEELTQRKAEHEEKKRRAQKDKADGYPTYEGLPIDVFIENRNYTINNAESCIISRQNHINKIPQELQEAEARFRERTSV